ncbi:MAG: hypothetical protein WAQ98_02695 [Blastocatellia bacterium]
MFDLTSYVANKQEKLAEQEKISLSVGKTYRKLGDQERATYYFSRANGFFKQRLELQQKVAAIAGSLIG